ncbi:DUF2971 domain-containing protein [Rhizobium leguminosarum]|uniref:DUF2971 domain-containing protein n=1 Tax=Rhizobium leguminosarum TaxID=384 RepID=UPI001C92614C|nr:DUF2971 domain-containing protein [Rhizobium leguminosarum]MBY2983636.1 DUF2971 domain-containing protein [Rhizobium leguminosarum]
MRLYHFTNTQYGLQNIEKKRLKIARILDLNDPFEFIAMKLETRVQRQHLRRRRDEIHARVGIICFSDRWNDPLMWSHYADRHRGICLGFDVSDAANPRRIRYRTDLPDPTTLGYASLEEMTEQQWSEMGFVKSRDWVYEREHRLVIDLKKADQDGTLYFQPFTADLQLAEVIVGARCQLHEDQLIGTLGANRQDVRRIKARLAFKSFTVVEQHDPSMWEATDQSQGDAA